MNYLDIFHFDNSKKNFDDYCNQDGDFPYWYASDLMKMLDYNSYDSFFKAINKAMTACMSINIPINENFIQVTNNDNKKEINEFKLSRFACYLTTMNANVTKPAVAQAQAYFATMAEAFRRYVQEAVEIERVIIREEISDHEKSLSSTAKEAGVAGVGYALFQNAGYRGMYNMNLSDLKSYKGIPSNRTPLDFMGTEELAANLFRITQTESKIRNERIRGQQNAERAAEEVGRKVRNTMREISGVTPESLATREDINKVKSALKSTEKSFKKISTK